MVEVLSYRAPIKLELSDLQKVLDKLSQEGWIPAFLQNQKNFLKLAGITDKEIPYLRKLGRMRYGLSIEQLPGDIFFKDADLFYIISFSDKRIYYERHYLFYEEPIIQEFEIGIITNDNKNINEKLNEFGNKIKETILAVVDGRKTRAMNFEWEIVTYKSKKIEDRIKDTESGTKLNFTPANLYEDEVNASNLIYNKEIRDLLIEINQAGFVRQRDLLVRNQKQKEKLLSILKKLDENDLIITEYLLECKKTSASLTKLKDKSLINSPEIGELLCPSCNAKFSEENLTEGYSLSQLGKKLIRQSYWMTVWVSTKLKELGIPLESILWNISESGEEVDMLVDLFGELWIFELKDREFGSGDAYPLNYRQVRYKANKSIIITTERISKEAKRVFEELTNESEDAKNLPIYIEGLDNTKKILSKEIAKTSLNYAYKRLRVLSEFSGYYLYPIITAKFGN